MIHGYVSPSGETVVGRSDRFQGASMNFGFGQFTRLGFFACQSATPSMVLEILAIRI